MSIKTLRKRIALVAVSALGVGLLSVAPASAGTGTITLDTAGQSTGIVTSTLAAGISGTSETATMSVTGTLVLDVTTGTRVIKVTGGKITTATFATTSNTKTIDANSTCAVGETGAIDDIKFQPNAAGTNMVISFIADVTACTTSTAAADVITVTVVAAGASGTFSLANSLISLTSDTSTTAAASDTVGADFVSYYSSTGEATINWTLKDVLGNNMPSNTTVTATVTKGSCLVSGSTGTEAVPFFSGDSPSDTVFITSANFNETCDVAIAVNGVAAATKSIKFSGPVASVNVTNVTTAKSSTAGNQTAKGYVNVKDSAGNKIGNVTVTADTTRYGSIVSALTLATATTSILNSDMTVNKGSNPGAVDTSFGVTCTGVKGTQKGMRLKYTSSAGVVTYSNEFDVSCFGGLFSYSASLDAASYTPGGIATLTVSAKDSAGNPVSDGTTLNNGAGGVTNTTVTCGGQATIVTAVATADAFTNGKKTYTFTLGTTEGAYQCVVSLGEYTVAGTGNTALAAQTVGWTLKSATASVSNAEVLAAIVKLIASINKQIKALQKSLRR